METIRVLIADDHRLLRDGLISALSTEQDIEVVGVAEDGEEAVRKALSLQPDIVLMDIKMPKCDGIEAALRLRQDLPTARIVIMTGFAEKPLVDDALKAGIAGFLLKDVPIESLVQVIRRVWAGESWIDPRIAPQVLDGYRRLSEENLALKRESALSKLTDRELEVLRALARGLSNKEIAQACFISEATVKSHVHHLLEKLGLQDRTQAALYAVEHGLNK